MMNLRHRKKAFKMYKRPKTDIVVNLTAESNNALRLCSIVVKALRVKGYERYANEVAHKVSGLHSKREAINIFREYVTVN